MKRTERVGAIIKILTDTPNKSYTLQYFCDLFGAAKSSISEDIKSAPSLPLRRTISQNFFCIFQGFP